MKLSECDARQKKAFINIAHCANWIIGGLENAMHDSHEGAPEYESAKAQLADHNGLVNQIYSEATTTVFSEGMMMCNKGAESFLRDIRFCGKDWLMARCDARVKKLGY